MKFCPYCGKSVDAGAAFCGFCGAALDPTSVEAPAAAASPTSVEAPAAAAPPAAAEAPAAVDSPAPHSAPSAPKADPAPNPGGKKKSKLPLVLGVLAAVLVVGVLCVGALVLAVFGLFSSPQSSVAKAADKTVDELSSYLRENEAMATVLDLYTQSDSGIGVAAVVGDSEVQLCLSREELRISGAGLSSAYSLPLENVKQSYYSSALGDWLGESAEMDSLLDALEDYHEGTSAGTELLDFVSELEVEKQEKETLSLRSGDAEATVYTAYLSESQLEELMALLSYTDFTASDGMGVRLYLCGGLIRRIVLDYVGSTLTITLNGSDNPWDRIEISGDDGEVTIRLKVSENSVSITADDGEWKWNTSSGVISALGAELPITVTADGSALELALDTGTASISLSITAGEELPDAETVNLLALDEEELAEVVRNEEILSTLGLSGLISNPYTALTGGLEQAVNAGSFSFDLSFDYNIDDYLSEQISGMVAYDLSTKTIRMLLEVEGYDVYLAYEDGSGSMAVLMDGEWYGQEMDEETLYYFEEVFASMEADNLGELEEMDWAELLESELGMDAATIEACLTEMISKLCTQYSLDNVLGYEHSSDGESSYYSFSPDLYSLAKLAIEALNPLYEDTDAYQEALEELEEIRSELSSATVMLSYNITGSYLTRLQFYLGFEGSYMEMTLSLNDIGEVVVPEVSYQSFDDLYSDPEDEVGSGATSEALGLYDTDALASYAEDLTDSLAYGFAVQDYRSDYGLIGYVMEAGVAEAAEYDEDFFDSIHEELLSYLTGEISSYDYEVTAYFPIEDLGIDVSDVVELLDECGCASDLWPLGGASVILYFYDEDGNTVTYSLDVIVYDTDSSVYYMIPNL